MKDIEELLLAMKQYLADDLVGAEYCPGRISFNWSLDRRAVCAPRAHSGLSEKEILKILQKDVSAKYSTEMDVLLLKGGVGTGKTTTLNRCFDIAAKGERVCVKNSEPNAKCRNEARFIRIDFKNWQKNHNSSDLNLLLNQFWEALAHKIEVFLPHNFSGNKEVSDFWCWAINQTSILEHSIGLTRFFRTNRPLIESYANGSGYLTFNFESLRYELERLRKSLISELESKDTAWYAALQIAYSNKKQQNGCCACYLLIDNIDGLHPLLQKEIVSFSQVLAEIIQARSVIALRPLTWKNTGSESSVEVISHVAPSITEVILKRLTQFVNAKKPDAKFHVVLTWFSEQLQDHTLFAQMLNATSGMSVRFGLRNFSNFIDSPLLRSALTTLTKEHNIRPTSNEIERAYYLSADEKFNFNAFENLYSVSGIIATETMLLKVRILDIVWRITTGAAITRDVSSSLEQIGYTRDEILKAMNELANPNRSLIWSEVGFELETLDSFARVMITPTGVEYLTKLFGNLGYAEACLGSYGIQIESVVELDRKIGQLEHDEMTRLRKQIGSKRFREKYPSSRVTFGQLHWSNLEPCLVHLSHAGVKIEYDGKRAHWLESYKDSLYTPTII